MLHFENLMDVGGEGGHECYCLLLLSDCFGVLPDTFPMAAAGIP